MKRIVDLHVMDRVVVTCLKTHEKKQGVILSIRYDRICRRVIICVYAENVLEHDEKQIHWYIPFTCTLDEYNTATQIEGWSNTDYTLNSDEQQQLKLF